MSPLRFAFAPSFILVVFGVLLANCSKVSREPFVLYDVSQGPVKGWSHIVTNPERFPLVALENSKYAVDERSMVEDESDNGGIAFRTVLVRKISNWGQQHANGIEPVFFETPLTVGDMESVTLQLKLNAADSRIPSREELRRHYAGALTPKQIDRLDAGVPCLGLTFVERGYQDQSKECLNAVYSLEFDPETDFDRWMEITIPLSDFTFGFNKNYSLREVERSSVLEHRWVGFRINPETTGGGVARNLIGEKWDDSVPECYKELSLSLTRIEVAMTKGGE